MWETVCLKFLKINQWYSLISRIKCGNLESRNNSEVVNYESKFCFELRILLKNEKVGFVSKTQQCFKFMNGKSDKLS